MLSFSFLFLFYSFVKLVIFLSHIVRNSFRVPSCVFKTYCFVKAILYAKARRNAIGGVRIVNADTADAVATDKDAAAVGSR